MVLIYLTRSLLYISTEPLFKRFEQFFYGPPIRVSYVLAVVSKQNKALQLYLLKTKVYCVQWKKQLIPTRFTRSVDFLPIDDAYRLKLRGFSFLFDGGADTSKDKSTRTNSFARKLEKF